MTERIMYSERHGEYNKQQNAQRMIKNVDTLVYTTYVHIKNMLRSSQNIGRVELSADTQCSCGLAT